MDQNKESRLVEQDSVHFRIKGGWHILKWNVTHSISEVGNCDRSYGKKNMIRHYKVIDKMRKSFFFFRLDCFRVSFVTMVCKHRPDATKRPTLVKQ